MHLGVKNFMAAVLLVCIQPMSGAQEPVIKGVPASVYYLMPSFGDGMIYFRGQGPAQGRLNICAVDNTLRFIDKDGSEMVASEIGNIAMVRIDTVSFIQDKGFFYRMYPVTGDMGVALKRKVRIAWDTKQGAYGLSSKTSSIKEYSTIYSEGAVYNLNEDKEYPYEISETLYVYNEGSVLLLTTKNLKKVFPDKKQEIDAWFKAGHPVPEKVDEALELLARWAQ